MPLLEMEQFGKSFHLSYLNKTIQATNQISFSIEKGEFIGIIGKSGSGKSTIIKSIYRTYVPDTGHILYASLAFGMIDLMQATDRQIVYLRKNEIGYVSQFLSVLPRRTALDLVIQSAREMGQSEDSARLESENILSHFDLDRSLWNTYPSTFSGGEKLRLNIAMAAIKKPRILLLDEPTASLDDRSKEKVRSMIKKLKKNGTTLIGIFHDLEFMEGLCDKVFHMSSKQTRKGGKSVDC